METHVVKSPNNIRSLWNFSPSFPLNIQIKTKTIATLSRSFPFWFFFQQQQGKLFMRAMK